MRAKDKAKSARKKQQAIKKDNARRAKMSCTMFGGEESEQLNALYSALRDAAERHGFSGEYKEYEFMEGTPEYQLIQELKKKPRTSLVVQMVDALHAMGYDIVYTGNHRHWGDE